MPCIKSLNYPKSAEELRAIIYHLLNDHFERGAMIDRQGSNYIEYRDHNRDDGYDIEADILIIDAEVHNYAWMRFDRWADDATPDDTRAASEAEKAAREAEPDPEKLRADVLIANAATKEEAFLLTMLRTWFDQGFTAGQIMRRMMLKPREDDPDDVISYDPKAVGDRMPALLRAVRAKMADFLETSLDRRVVRVEASLFSEGACRFRVDFKPAKKSGIPDAVFVTITPGV